MKLPTAIKHLSNLNIEPTLDNLVKVTNLNTSQVVESLSLNKIYLNIVANAKGENVYTFKDASSIIADRTSAHRLFTLTIPEDFSNAYLNVANFDDNDYVQSHAAIEQALGSTGFYHFLPSYSETGLTIDLPKPLPYERLILRVEESKTAVLQALGHALGFMLDDHASDPESGWLLQRYTYPAVIKSEI